MMSNLNIFQKVNHLGQMAEEWAQDMAPIQHQCHKFWSQDVQFPWVFSTEYLKAFTFIMLVPCLYYKTKFPTITHAPNSITLGTQMCDYTKEKKEV